MTITYDLDLAPNLADDEAIIAGLQESNAKATGHKTQHYSVWHIATSYRCLYICQSSYLGVLYLQKK